MANLHHRPPGKLDIPLTEGGFRRRASHAGNLTPANVWGALGGKTHTGGKGWGRKLPTSWVDRDQTPCSWASSSYPLVKTSEQTSTDVYRRCQGLKYGHILHQAIHGEMNIYSSQTFTSQSFAFCVPIFVPWQYHVFTVLEKKTQSMPQ